MTDDERIARERLMENDRARDLIAAIDLGLSVRQLIDSDLGKQLIRDAEEQRGDLVEQLVSVNGAESNSVMRLQAEIWSIDWWQQKFANYIQRGVQAEIELAQFDITD